MDRHLVRKSNYLIEASYKLSAVEQKIILILASMIKHDDREFKTYSLKIQSVIEVLGLQTKNGYAYLKEATRNLMGKVFTITTPDSELQTHWFSSAEYFDGRGEVEFSFDPKLKPFLLQLKERYTTYRLKEAIQLKSSFSIRMLELLRQYEKLGERVIELRRLRELLGVGEDQYRLYADFKKRVIIPAQKELTAKTDIAFKFEEMKTGHAVDRLRFKIRTVARKPKTATEEITPTLADDPDLERLLQLLPETYREKRSIRKMLSGYLKRLGYDFVARNIVYANEKSNAVKHIDGIGTSGNYRNYLAKTLRGDFGLAHQEDKEVRKAAADKVRRKRDAEIEAARQERERIQREQENKERARVYRQSLTPDALNALREEALANMDPEQRALVVRKSIGADLILTMAMDKICLERMKIT